MLIRTQLRKRKILEVIEERLLYYSNECEKTEGEELGKEGFLQC